MSKARERPGLLLDTQATCQASQGKVLFVVEAVVDVQFGKSPPPRFLPMQAARDIVALSRWDSNLSRDGLNPAHVPRSLLVG